MGNPSQRDRRLAALAQRQFGVFAGDQAVSSGFSRWTIQARVRRGEWVRVIGDAYRLAATPAAWRHALVGAYLTIGDPAAISGSAALSMWELANPTWEPEVLVPWNRRPRQPGLRVARTRRWTRSEIVLMGPARITNPMRTLLDVASRVSEADLEVVLDVAHRRRLIEPVRFAGYLESASVAKIAGATSLLRLVHLRNPGRAIESAAETLLFRALRGAGLPLPVPQYWVRTRRGRHRVDFAYPDRRLVIEFDSIEVHDGRRALDADSARDNALADAGWDRRHITWTMLKANPAEVAWTVGNALGLQPRSWREQGK